MQAIHFHLDGERHLVVPDGEMAANIALDIVRGVTYPFPDDETPKVIVDIGAHAGEFTLVAALLWPEAVVHAYEPYPPMVKLLEYNMQPAPNVVIHREAVGQEAGQMPLYVSNLGTLCNSLLPQADVPRIPVDVVGPEAIAVLEPDLLKIDCEGGEYAILSGLDCARIQRIYVEFHCESDRIGISRLLDPTHSLIKADIPKAGRGELTYVRRP